MLCKDGSLKPPRCMKLPSLIDRIKLARYCYGTRMEGRCPCLPSQISNAQSTVEITIAGKGEHPTGNIPTASL
jgi:hypothetical protein